MKLAHALAVPPIAAASESGAQAPEDYVWIEGEAPASIPAGMAPAVARSPSFLSGGRWLTFGAEAGEVEKKVPAE